MNKMHCSACGSTNLLGLAKSAIHIVAGTSGPVEQKFKTYRCRKCAEVSDEYITLNYCDAPPIETLRTKVPTVMLSRDERKEKIEEILRLAGINPRQKLKSDPSEWKDDFFVDAPKEEPK